MLASRVQLNTCVRPRGLDSIARLRVDVIFERVWADSGTRKDRNARGKIPIIIHFWITAASRSLPFYF